MLLFDMHIDVEVSKVQILGSLIKSMTKWSLDNISHFSSSSDDASKSMPFVV